MVGEMTNRSGAELVYAPPPKTTDLFVSRDAQGLRFELGPMSTSLFLARLVPWALWLGLLLAIVVLDSRPVRRLYVFGGLLILATTHLVVLCKRRNQPRAVGVVDGQVFYSDDRTRGVPMSVKPREVTALRVYRIWWRPWIFALATVPPPKFMGISATHPVVLLMGLDWRLLDRLRWELSVALGLETTNETVGTTAT